MNRTHRKQSRMIAAVLLAVMLLGLLAGCGGASNTESSPSASATAPTGQVEKEGKKEITIATAAIPNGLNIANAIATPQRQYFSLIYDYLIFRTNDGSFEPCLITEWKPSEDLCQWTVKLREGIKFSNDTPFTTDTIKTTFEYIASDPKHSFYSKWKTLESVEILSDYECIFHFSEGNGDFLSNTALSCYVEPKSFKELGADKYFENPIGCGMYTLSSWVPGNEMVFERNDGYWAKDMYKNNIDKITVRQISESLTRVSALTNGEVDAIYNVPYEFISNVEGENSLNIQYVPSTTAYYMAFQSAEGRIMNDANIRRAVSASIDRDLIASSIYGNGNAIKQFLPEGTNGFIGGGYTAKWYEYNIDEAKNLLKNSSYDGSTIEVVVDSSLANSTQLSAALLSMLQEAGMKVNLQFVEAAAMSSIFAEGKYDIVVRSFGHSPDTCPFLFTLIVEDFMKTKYDNKEMMDYFRAACMEIDMDKRAELVQKGAALANDECAPVVPIIAPTISIACKKSISGIDLFRNSYIDWRNMTYNP